MFIKSNYWNHYYKVLGIRDVVSETKHLTPLGYKPSYRITVIYDPVTCKLRTTQSIGPETPSMSDCEFKLFAYIHPVTTKMVVEDISYELDAVYMADKEYLKIEKRKV